MLIKCLGIQIFSSEAAFNLPENTFKIRTKKRTLTTLFEVDFACQIRAAKPELNNLKLKVTFCIDRENKTHFETSCVNQKLIIVFLTRL